MDEQDYLPILTGKQGEYRAMKVLSLDVKSKLTPLIEIPPIDWNFQDDVPANTLDEQIANVADNVENHWGVDAIYIDTYPLESEGVTAAGVYSLTHILNDGRSRGLSMIPVTGLNRGAQHQQAVRNAISLDSRGVCVRLLAADFTADVAMPIHALLAELGATPAEVDLLIDLGPMNSQFESHYPIMAIQLINSLPTIAEWRSLVLAGASFPNDLSGVTPNSTQSIRRTEWQVWKNVMTAAKVDRMPSFSDYSITSPEYVSLDFRIIKMSAAIRYTHSDEWIVVKGQVIRKGESSQFPSLASRLRALPQYSGRDFSWGDAYIDDCASGIGGPGSATTWRQVGTNHHLTFVVRQLASFFSP